MRCTYHVLGEPQAEYVPLYPDFDPVSSHATPVGACLVHQLTQECTDLPLSSSSSSDQRFYQAQCPVPWGAVDLEGCTLRQFRGDLSGIAQMRWHGDGLEHRCSPGRQGFQGNDDRLIVLAVADRNLHAVRDPAFTLRGSSPELITIALLMGNHQPVPLGFLQCGHHLLHHPGFLFLLDSAGWAHGRTLSALAPWCERSAFIFLRKEGGVDSHFSVMVVGFLKVNGPFLGQGG